MAFTKRQKQHLAKLRAYKELFNSATGRIVLLDLMRQFRMSAPLIPNTDELTTEKIMFAEGQRNAVLYIINQLGFDVQDVEEAIKEQNKKDRALQSDFDQFD